MMHIVSKMQLPHCLLVTNYKRTVLLKVIMFWKELNLSSCSCLHFSEKTEVASDPDVFPVYKRAEDELSNDKNVDP